MHCSACLGRASTAILPALKEEDDMNGQEGIRLNIFIELHYISQLSALLAQQHCQCK